MSVGTVWIIWFVVVIMGLGFGKLLLRRIELRDILDSALFYDSQTNEFYKIDEYHRRPLEFGEICSLLKNPKYLVIDPKTQQQLTCQEVQAQISLGIFDRTFQIRKRSNV